MLVMRQKVAAILYITLIMKQTHVQMGHYIQFLHTILPQCVLAIG